MTPEAQIVRAVLHGSTAINHWKRSGVGTYEINMGTTGKSGVETVHVLDAHLAEVDERLPALAAHFASINTLGMVSKRKVAMNLFSHWSRKNHVLDTQVHDTFASRADAFRATWYIHEFRGLGRVKGAPDSVWVDTICYRTEQSDIGFEYIAEIQKPQVKRSVAWLDQHLGSGKNILLLTNSLELTTAERRQYLHNTYLTVLGCQERQTLPDGLSFP